MRVALYLRRSTTDLQPDSLEIQEAILRAYADAQRHEVVDVFRDSASGRSVKKRDAFRALIARVKNAPGFEAVLVRDVSRWSRADNTDEAGYYEFVCRSHGVQIVYVEESFGPSDSPYALLLKSIKRTMAAEFSRDRARLSMAGARRAAAAGFWPSGCAPYAMRRLLVDEEGRELQRLAPGERKAVSGARVKLAPGDPEKLATVRRIFEQYTENGESIDRIAEALNAEGVPSSWSRRWTPGTVSHVLRNEVYAGAVVYRRRGGDSPSKLRDLDPESERIVRCANAHPAIVSRAEWEKAQARLAESRHRRTPRELVAELKAARRSWSQMPCRELPGETFREGYGRPDAEVIGGERATAVRAFRAALESQFSVSDFEGGWLIDHLLHVTLLFSLPHSRFGSLHWNFRFTGDETADVVLSLGFSPPPFVAHVETYCFRAFRWRAGVRRPLIDSRGKPWVRLRDTPHLFDRLRRAFWFRGRRAADLFLATVRQRESISLTAVSKELGWPLPATATLYRKLEHQGVALPRLANGRSAITIRVECPHCRRIRHLAPRVAAALDTAVCFECLHRPPLRAPAALRAVCPRCQSVRLVAFRRLRLEPNALTRLCRACMLAEGRRKGIAWSRSRKEGR